MNIESMFSFSEDELKKAILKDELEEDLFNYVKWSFEKKKKMTFIENWHHKLICDALMKVHRGEIQNLIINLPPRYSKTEIAVKGFVEWAIAKNPRSKFIHLTYSNTLALDNSSEIREDMKSEWYQEFWPYETKKDKDSKEKWETLQGGGVYATGTQGSITGFGAGKVGNDDEFEGAIIIDDPHKPEDASSDNVRKKDNERLNNTILSRRNNTRRTPVIIIMQRLHEEDMSGFCLNGGTPEKWVHLCIPALNDESEALWPLKHTVEELHRMELADRMTFAGQYMQAPAPAEGLLCKREWIKYYTTPPERFDKQLQSWDFAVKDKKINDFNAGGAFGSVGADKYLYDLFHKKADFPTAQKHFEAFCKKHPRAYEKLIEDKANGSPMIQTMKGKIGGIIPMTPTADKVFRFNAVLPDIEAGNFWLPHPSICPKIEIAPGVFKAWSEIVADELCTFPNAKHDDIVDIVSMALLRLRSPQNLTAPTTGHGSGVIYT